MFRGNINFKLILKPRKAALFESKADIAPCISPGRNDFPLNARINNAYLKQRSKYMSFFVTDSAALDS